MEAKKVIYEINNKKYVLFEQNFPFDEEEIEFIVDVVRDNNGIIQKCDIKNSSLFSKRAEVSMLIPEENALKFSQKII